MELLENRFNDQQILVRIRNCLTKYFGGKKNAAIRIEHFRQLDHVNNAFNEVEFAKAHTEHEKPIIAGFFILQCTKQRMLELYYYSLMKDSDVYKFEFLGMDTGSLYLALAEKELEDGIEPEMEAEWERLLSKDCTVTFITEAAGSFFPSVLCQTQKT